MFKREESFYWISDPTAELTSKFIFKRMSKNLQYKQEQLEQGIMQVAAHSLTCKNSAYAPVHSFKRKHCKIGGEKHRALVQAIAKEVYELRSLHFQSSV